MSTVNSVDAALINGDLSMLNASDKLTHYMDVCKSLGLNYHTKPLGYILLNGKLTLYALKSCTDQLRAINGVSVVSITTSIMGDIVTVTAVVRDKNGREDTDIGCVSIAGLKGDLLANAHMKSITKAKRRATLSLCGLGWLDETEVETIPSAKIIPHENILDVPKVDKKDLKPLPVNEWVAGGATGAEKLVFGKAEFITDEQLKEIGRLKKLMQFTLAEAAQWETMVKADYGVSGPKELAANDATVIINDLKIMLENKGAK